MTPSTAVLSGATDAARQDVRQDPQFDYVTRVCRHISAAHRDTDPPTATQTPAFTPAPPAYIDGEHETLPDAPTEKQWVCEECGWCDETAPLNASGRPVCRQCSKPLPDSSSLLEDVLTGVIATVSGRD